MLWAQCLVAGLRPLAPFVRQLAIYSGAADVQNLRRLDHIVLCLLNGFVDHCVSHVFEPAGAAKRFISRHSLECGLDAHETSWGQFKAVAIHSVLAWQN